MYYGSDEFNSIIDSTQGSNVSVRLKFAEDEIIDAISTCRFYGGSNDTDDITVGTTMTQYVDATVFTDKLLGNREFLLEASVKLSDGTYEYAPIGYFTVKSPKGDNDEVSFVAYDRMIKFEKVYSSALTYPTDSEVILNELCALCGVELTTTIDTPITITENLQGYTCREVLGYIAGIHGYFACFDRFGKLNLRWYEENSIEKTLKYIWSFDKSQDLHTIGKVEVAKNSETTYTSGDGITTLHHSNPYATQEIVDSLFAKLNDYSYNSGEIDMLDDIRLDPWDVVKVEYYDNVVYHFPLMSIQHDFGASNTVIKAFAKDVESEYRFTGPTIKYLNRVASDMLIANRVLATKVDAEYVNSHAITTENFDAKVAEIKELVVEEIDGKYADIDLANIDIANINVGKIGELFAKVGLIDRATIVEGHITGFLDAVEINANKITAGTLIADRILLSGEEGSVLYALNNLGELTSTNVDTLDGYILTDRTITADKIVAKSITTNELDVDKIFGNEAVLNKIVSQDAFINAIETNRIIVGLSDEIANKTPLIEGTQTTATQTWTGNAPFSELKNGQTIMYGLSNRGNSGNSTLTLILANGTITSALPIYYQGNTRVTTQYSIGALITMTYRENVKIGSNTYTGWWTTVDSNTYDRIRYSVVIKAQSAIVANNIIVGTSSGYKHLKVGTAFDISYPILFADSAISANATGNNNYIAVPVTISTTQSLTMTAYKPVYIKGKLSGTTFTPVSATPLTQTVPTSEDGYQYILLGTANSSTQLYMSSEHPIYQFVAGKFQQIDSGANANAEEIKNNIYYSGTTQINGNRIYTGSITADKIDVNDLFAQEITATGSITGATLVSLKNEASKVIIDKGRITIYDFDTRGDGGFYEIGSLYNAGHAVGASGAWYFDSVGTTSGANLDTINSNLNNRGYSRIIAQNIPQNIVKTATVEDLNNFKYILARIVTSGGAVPIIVPTELALYDKLEYANSFHSTLGNIISISIKAVSNTQLQVWGNCTGYNFTKIEVLGVY